MEASSSGYHTGIRRDPDDISTWRRVGDGQAVELSPDGWHEGYPRSDHGWTYLRWYRYNIDDNDYYNYYYYHYVGLHNQVFNSLDTEAYFICETILDEF